MRCRSADLSIELDGRQESGVVNRPPGMLRPAQDPEGVFAVWAHPQGSLERFLDDGSEGGPALEGARLGSPQQVVFDVQRGLHGGAVRMVAEARKRACINMGDGPIFPYQTATDKDMRTQTGRQRGPQGSSASPSISTLARGSISPETCTRVMAGKCLPRVSAQALPTAAPARLNSPMSVT